MLEESIKDFFENLDFAEMSYFYHITGAGNGEKINEEGLLMADPHLWSTTIEITPEMITNPHKFVSEEKGNNLRQTDEMVLIGCPKEDVEYLVAPNESLSWNAEEKADYIIPRDYIIGYIDMRNADEEFFITLNSNYFNYGGR